MSMRVSFPQHHWFACRGGSHGPPEQKLSLPKGEVSKRDLLACNTFLKLPINPSQTKTHPNSPIFVRATLKLPTTFRAPPPAWSITITAASQMDFWKLTVSSPSSRTASPVASASRWTMCCSGSALGGPRKAASPESSESSWPGNGGSLEEWLRKWWMANPNLWPTIGKVKKSTIGYLWICWYLLGW